MNKAPNTQSTKSKNKLKLAFALIVLAPLVAEFLLGNQPITVLWAMVLFAPLYGCAALLIREITRRNNRGWPTIILLSMAFALLLEGILDQMIFNPEYLNLDSFDNWAVIPGTGASATLIQGSLSLHTIWSMCIPPYCL